MNAKTGTMPQTGPHVSHKSRKAIHCMKCEHEWFPMVEGVLPRACPKCKNAKYNLPKLIGRGRPVKTPPKVS